MTRHHSVLVVGGGTGGHPTAQIQARQHRFPALIQGRHQIFTGAGGRQFLDPDVPEGHGVAVACESEVADGAVLARVR